MKIAKKISNKLGGYKELAKAAKREPSTAWRRLNGNGQIPRCAMRNVIDHARSNNLDLGLGFNDFIPSWGRKRKLSNIDYDDMEFLLEAAHIDEESMHIMVFNYIKARRLHHDTQRHN